MAEHSDDLRDQRLAKLQRLRERNLDPYPARVKRSVDTATAVRLFQERTEQAEGAQGPEVSVAGRISAMRLMGKAAFLDLRDGSGRLQAYFRRDNLGPPKADYELLHDLDLGDFLNVEGPLF